jgi:hypothetical protein
MSKQTFTDLQQLATAFCHFPIAPSNLIHTDKLQISSSTPICQVASTPAWEANFSLTRENPKQKTGKAQWAVLANGSCHTSLHSSFKVSTQ